VVFSIGEMTHAPRYYEYISDLAPKGQQGLFQGYAFLPVSIAWLVGGPLGGWLYVHFAKGSEHPSTVWYALFFIGIVATLSMAVYNKFVGAQEARSAAA
jgi:proton-dependent oligopeptide transporter, POT family